MARKPSKVMRFYLPTFDALEDRAMPALAGTLDGLFGVGGAAFAQFGSNAAQAYGIYRDNVTNTGIYAAGLVNNGSDQIALVRLNLDGSRDLTFGTQGMVVTPIGSGSRAEDVTGGIDPVDGKFKVVVVGETSTAAGNDIVVVRYNANGSLDSSFGNNGAVVINLPTDDKGARVLFDSATGKTTIVGSAFDGSRSDFVLVRLNENGSLDQTFGGPGKGVVDQIVGQNDVASGLAIDASGNIYVGGTSLTSATGRDFVVARYSATGILDTTYGASGVARVNVGASPSDDDATSLRLDSAGQIVIAGAVRSGQDEDFGLVRLTSTGTLDGSFIGGGKTVVSFQANQNERLNDIVIDSAGAIVAVGTTQDFSSASGPVSTLIARFTPAGGLDNSFGTGGYALTQLSGGQPNQSDDAQAVTLDGAGKILVAGHSFYNGSDVIDVQRFDAVTIASSALSASTHTYTVPTGMTFDSTLSGQVGLLAGGQLSNNLPVRAVLVGSSATAQGSVTVNANGSFVYTPIAGATGTDSFQYQLADNLGAKSAPVTVTLNFSAVNNAPVLVSGVPLPGILEDEVGNPGFSVSTLVTTSAYSDANAGDARGVAITFVDTTNGTWQYQLTGTNAWVNFPPINSAAGEAVHLFDSSNVRFVPNPDFNGNATFKYVGWDRTNLSSALTDGTLAVINATGGSTAYSDIAAEQGGTIAVAPVNDPPSFVKGADQIVLEDAGPQTIAAWATFISQGPADESSQKLTFTVTNNNDALFASGPSIAPDGTLTYSLLPNANGVATVTVILRDDGGGADTSPPQTFVITVLPVLDVLPAANDVIANVAEDSLTFTIAPASLMANEITAHLFGDVPNLAIVGAVSGIGGAVSFGRSGIDFTPTPDYNGPAQFFYVLRNLSAVQGQIDDYLVSVSFVVTEVNDAPTVQNQTLSFYDPVQGPRFISWADLLGNASPGPANESSQHVIGISAFNALGGTVEAVVGGVLFSPTDGFNGVASFTFFAVDDGTTNGAADPKSATGVATFVLGPSLPPAATSPGTTTTSTTSTTTTSGARAFEAAVLSGGDGVVLADTSVQSSTSTDSNDDLDQFSRSIRAVYAPPPAPRAGIGIAWGELDPRIAVVAQILQSSPESRLALPTVGLSDTMSSVPETARRGRLLQIVTSQFDGEDSVWIIEGILRGANAPAAPATVRPVNLQPAPPLVPAVPLPPAPALEQTSWLRPVGRWAVGMALFMGLVANVAFAPFADKELFPTAPRKTRRERGNREPGA